jgi:hypothetical protein
VTQLVQGTHQGPPDLRVVFYEQELSHGRTVSLALPERATMRFSSAAVRESWLRPLA